MKLPLTPLILAGLIYLALPLSSGATQLREYVVSAGGGRMTSAGHAIECTVGETAIGGICGSAHALYAGLWHPLGWYCSSSSVEDFESVPSRFALESLTPSPFSQSGSIRFAAARPARISIAVYDITGRMVEKLVDAELPAGWHTVDLRGEDLRSGLYFCRMTAPGFSATRKLVLTK